MLLKINTIKKLSSSSLLLLNHSKPTVHHNKNVNNILTHMQKNIAIKYIVKKNYKSIRIQLKTLANHLQ